MSAGSAGPYDGSDERSRDGRRRRFAVNLPVAFGVARRPWDVAGRWLLLLVALGGLLAMHGFSDHGVGGPAAVASSATNAAVSAPAGMAAVPSTTGTHPGSHHPGHAADSTAPHAVLTEPAAVGAVGTPAGGPGDHHGGGHGTSAAEMCLAVLAAVLLLALTTRRLGLGVRVRDAFLDVAAVVSAVAFWARARGPAPPDLRLLSIQRC